MKAGTTKAGPEAVAGTTKREAPLSLRLPTDLVARVEAWAAQQDCARNAAVISLIERGLMNAETARSQAILDLAQRRASAVVQRGQDEVRERFFGTTALGEPLPERKAYQKGQSKGAARR